MSDTCYKRVVNVEETIEVKLAAVVSIAPVWHQRSLKALLMISDVIYDKSPVFTWSLSHFWG